MTSENNQDENKIEVNGYTVEFSEMWNEWHITHPHIGFCTHFKEREEAIDYADRG